MPGEIEKHFILALKCWKQKSSYRKFPKPSKKQD